MWGLRAAAVGALAVGAAGCRAAPPKSAGGDTATDSVAVVDSVNDVRPDSVRSTPPDSTTITLALLPAPSAGDLSGLAAELEDRAVFVPRTQRWFVARMVDSTLLLDIGRLDGGVTDGPAGQEAFQRLVAARSPLQPGAELVLHSARGAVVARVTGHRTFGRRIVVTLDATVPDTASAFPVEWRGSGPPAVSPASARCAPGRVAEIDQAIGKIAVPDSTRRTVLRGCFGAYRALVVVRPITVTTESVERVTLVDSTGAMRRGRLRDLAYPLHDLVALTELTHDGVDDIVVRSARPAMETWSVLRMTDSVSFTRIASGFTIERR